MTSFRTKDPIQFVKFIDRLVTGATEAVRLGTADALFELRDELVQNTPVDTAFAQSSWYDSATPGRSHPKPPDPEEKKRIRMANRYARSIMRGKARISTYWGWQYLKNEPFRATKTGRYFIGNSAPYIAKLNATHPTAARWVDRAKRRFKPNLLRCIAARRAKR